jgi:hypothetical protein
MRRIVHEAQSSEGLGISESENPLAHGFRPLGKARRCRVLAPSSRENVIFKERSILAGERSNPPADRLKNGVNILTFNGPRLTALLGGRNFAAQVQPTQKSTR